MEIFSEILISWIKDIGYNSLGWLAYNISFIFGYLMPNPINTSSSYRVGSTDIPDPLSPLLPIVHRPR